MDESIKGIEKILVNEKAGEILVIVNSDQAFGQSQNTFIKKLLKKFKINKDIRIEIVQSAKDCSVDALFNRYWTFFRSLWGRTYPHCRIWIDGCTYKFERERLFIEFSEQLAIQSLLERDFKNFTQRVINALSGKDVPVSLRLNEQQKQIHSTGHRENAQREELKEIKRIVQQNAKKGENNLDTRVIIGKPFRGTPKPINEIIQDFDTIIVEGDICKLDIKELRSKRFPVLLSLSVTDYEDTIECRFFIDKLKKERAGTLFRIGDRVKIKGEAQYNKYVRDITIIGRHALLIPSKPRFDCEKEKRIELHAHTRFSALDGTASVEALLERAAKWGHSAIAITDHGVVQAFPDAFEASRKTGIKVIYGLEGYLVDDEYINQQAAFKWDEHNHFVVFDIETTGLNPTRDKITEIGAVRIRDGKITDTFHSLINPGIPIPMEIVKLTGITDKMIKDAPSAEQVIPAFLNFVGDGVLVAHNAPFDLGFLQIETAELGLNIKNEVVDTLALSRRLFPHLKTHRLSALATHLKVNVNRAHRAEDDALTTAKILIKCMTCIKENEGFTGPISKKTPLFKEILKKLRPYHVTLLVQNPAGLDNLYRLVSKSHLDYFYKNPRIPKSLLMERREGLLLGSACEAGELYRAVIGGKSDEQLERIASFYDYLEVQPLGNNRFMVDNGTVKNIEEIKDANIKVYEIGKKLGIPVVATGDVHFIDPTDNVFRKVVMAGKGVKDAVRQGPLYLHTTLEMLKEFEYFGENIAKELVIKNPREINERIEENILPVPLKTYPPTIPGAAENLERIVWKRAKEFYGEPLPQIVEERLKKELKAIIDNGYAVMFFIAQKLVSKSKQDGYLVGSRGSVGSSLVATMSGITEVNPLPPHYLCSDCKYSCFIRDGSIGAGPDLADKSCPKCGAFLNKYGFDIPFEVFMGLEGDKEPDIDLNFSGEYQSKAHRFAEELFGKEKVYRAGTISTLADKTAYGFVKGYLEEQNLTVHNAEVNRLVQGCAGIKRTTGQHPGGIMIVPRDMDIHQFTPVQRPANDQNAEVITTHFDYRAISGRLLKLDILGHDDPTMLKMLHRLTGKDPKAIPLGDGKTMALFSSTESLNIKPGDIDCPVGSMGIPEFGTRFVRQILQDTRPTTISELVRISGLSHGTNVWLNNAQKLIQKGVTTLKEVISTRDDIFISLVQKGMQPETAFAIMERVRKGKGLNSGNIEAMRSVGCPQWFIESCKSIKYMFPKAHAAAYVSMAFKIAYYKVHYPLAFYAAYFSTRADEFDAQLIVSSKEAVKKTIKKYETCKNELTNKERMLLTVLEVALEMYCRGFSFLPVDLYDSHGMNFLIKGKKLLPPLRALQGLGEGAAMNIIEAKNKGPFISIEDLQERARVNRTVIDILREHGCLASLPESNQISLF